MTNPSLHALYAAYGEKMVQLEILQIEVQQIKQAIGQTMNQPPRDAPQDGIAAE